MTRLVLKPGAIRELRYLPGVAKELERHGQRIEAEANAELGDTKDVEPGYQMSSRPSKDERGGRWRVAVMAVSIHARRHDRKNQTLVRLLKR